jgi:hypothetical protein
LTNTNGLKEHSVSTSYRPGSIEAAGFSETSVNVYQTLLYIPEDTGLELSRIVVFWRIFPVKKT